MRLKYYIFLFLIFTSLNSFGQKELMSYGDKIKMISLDINETVIEITFNYLFSLTDSINEECPCKTINEINDGLVLPEIRSVIRSNISRIEQDLIKDLDINNLKIEISDLVNREFIFNDEEGICKIKLERFEILEINY